MSHLNLPEVHRGKVNAKIHKLKIKNQSRVQSRDVDTASEFSQCTSWLPYLQLCNLTPESMRWGDTWLVDFFNQGFGIAQNYLRKPGQIKATHVCWLTFGDFERP